MAKFRHSPHTLSCTGQQQVFSADRYRNRNLSIKRQRTKKALNDQLLAVPFRAQNFRRCLDQSVEDSASDEIAYNVDLFAMYRTSFATIGEL